MFAQHEKNGADKFIKQMKNDIVRDEGLEVGEAKKGDNAQDFNTSQRPRYTLSKFLNIFTKGNSSPYVFIIEKIHSGLGRIGKRGLDEKGKSEISNLIQELNKTAPQIAELLEEIIQDYGYDLDMEIPREMALLGYLALSAYQINKANIHHKKRMINENKKNESSVNNVSSWANEENLGVNLW